MTRSALQRTFSDLNGVERIARLAEPLTLDGAPRGDDPEPGDLGCYAPSQDLVLYYGDVGYWDGIVRLGRFSDADTVFLEDLPDDVAAVLTAPEA